MDYLVYFASALSSARLKAEIVTRWGLAAEAVFAGAAATFEEYEGPYPTVLIQTGLRPGSEFDTELSAGREFAERTGGLGELHVATVLCKALGTRALVDDGGRADSTWMLVTEDGWHGRVVLREDDFDDDRMVVDHALQTVPAAPEIPFAAPPEWQRGWYDDGAVPAAGYLETD